MAREYNYARFDEYVERSEEIEEFGAFPNHPHAGEPAPDLVATRLEDGGEIRLSEVWRHRPVVIEFGSFT